MNPLFAAIGRVLDAVRSPDRLWTASLALDRIGIGMLRFWPPKIVSAELLRNQVSSILRGFGMPEEHVFITTEYMMYADLRGIDSHGCGLLLFYYRDLIAGFLSMSPKIQVVRESETTALLDGGGGLGHVPGDMAMKLAIQKCHKMGVGIAAVRNSGHYGAAGAYAALAAQSGFIGISTTNTALPAVVPTFGLEAMLGTNPIAFAAPAKKNKPFLLDMSTSTVPLGKVAIASNTGHSIPIGWAMDAKGAPATNARSALKHRMLTPLGGNREMSSHKGYGLAFMVEILSSILPGLQKNDKQKSGDTGHFFLALDPQRFRDAGEFESDLDAMMDSFRNSKPADVKQPVLIAGDPEYAAIAERTSGIPVSRSVIEDMQKICEAISVPFLLRDAK